MVLLDPLTAFPPSSLLLGSVGFYFILTALLSHLRAPRYPKGIKDIGAGKGYFAPLKQSLLWVQDGYNEYNKKGLAYVIPGFLGTEPQVVMPRSQVAWMLDQPDNILSTSEAHYDSLHGEYSFVTPALLKDPYHENVIHRSLARHLPALVPEIEAEVRVQVDNIFGRDSEEWKTINIWDMLMKFIPPVTNRMLIGAPVCHNQEYLANMVSITNDVVRNLLVLKMIPLGVKPIVGAIMSLPAKYHFGQSARHSLPIIKQRLADMERKDSGDPAYADWVPPNDYITWHITLARAEHKLSELDPTRIAQRLVPLNFAAIHTTAITALNSFLDILSSDAKHNTLALLTDEVRRVYAEEGGSWTKAGLGRLYRLDSAIRESTRVSPFAQTQALRKVVVREGLTHPETGWHFDYGTILTCPLYGAQMDPELYGQDAHTYDPFRFSRAREEFQGRDARDKGADERLKLQKTGLVTTSDSYLAFGHGRHACPGRFFVAQELKMLFSHLLLNYDLMPMEGKPQPRWIANLNIPERDANIRVRRKPE